MDCNTVAYLTKSWAENSAEHIRDGAEELTSFLGRVDGMGELMNFQQISEKLRSYSVQAFKKVASQ